MGERVLVSVVMITYGHEKYIRQAIEGVLMQEGDFDLELVIANDCSPDNTDAIIRQIILENKSKCVIKYFLHENNLGIMPNFYFALEQCKGQYIAICEGDDYWIDSLKINKQLHILNSNVNVGLVYTNVRRYIQEKSIFLDSPIDEVNFKNQVPKMLEGKYIEFASTLFKQELLFSIMEDLKSEIMDKVIGDTRILLEAAHRTRIACLHDVTTVYRINEGSITRTKNLSKMMFVILDSYFCRKTFIERYKYPSNLLSNSIINTFRSLINLAYQESNYLKSNQILRNIPLIDLVKYGNKRHFFKKLKYKELLKLMLTITGIKNILSIFKR